MEDENGALAGPGRANGHGQHLAPEASPIGRSSRRIYRSANVLLRIQP